MFGEICFELLGAISFIMDKRCPALVLFPIPKRTAPEYFFDDNVELRI